MVIKIGINGFGNIGRSIFWAAQMYNNIKIIAINDLLDLKYILYMLKCDLINNFYNYNIFIKNNKLIINNNIIHYTSIININFLNWGLIGVDVVIESTGNFLTKKKLKKYIFMGVKKVIITSLPKDNIPIFILGVNENTYSGQNIISIGSFIMNSLAPIIKILNNKYNIIDCTLNVINYFNFKKNNLSYINVDKIFYKVIPEIKNKIKEIYFTIPIPNVLIFDLIFYFKYNIYYKNIYDIIKIYFNNKFINYLKYINNKNFIDNKEFITIFNTKICFYIENCFLKLIFSFDNKINYFNKILDMVLYMFNN